MEFQIEKVIQAPADQVWDVVGNNFNEISQWASAVATSEPNPDLAPDERGRVCTLENGGELVETVNKYDDSNRELRFTLESDNLPFFVKGIENTWRVEPSDNNQSLVHVHANVTLSPLFNLISGPLSKGFSKQGMGILNDLKKYVENQKVLA